VGAAIENVRLFQAKQQRNAELAIINSLQDALVSKLDLQAVFESIGEKVCEVFSVQVVDIVTYDQASNLISMPYSYEKGDRSVIEPREPYGFRLHVISSGEPLLINEKFAALAAQYNNPILTGACPKSALFVPLLVEDNVKGIISIQDLDREHAFSDSDVRLLQTLANAMSVSIENARLFDETQRLLKETEQRNRELSIINNIQQSLASKLDYQAIIDLFGDELARIYTSQERQSHSYSVYIALYDPQTDMIQFPYLIDGAGERFTEPPTPLGPGLTSSIIRLGQPLVLKTLDEQIAHGVIGFTQAKEPIGSQSWMGVPIRSGAQVIGVISMQDQRPNLFTESDVRILSTLAASLAVALENARLFDELKRQKEYAQEAQRRLADIINFLPDATLVIDSQGKVIAWNHAIEEMTGVPAQAMLGKSDYEYAVPFYGERRPILIDLVCLPQAEMEKKYVQIQRAGWVLTGETYTQLYAEVPLPLCHRLRFA
jgi:GAF domain-containing protein